MEARPEVHMGGARMPGSDRLLQKFASVLASPALTFIAQIPKVPAPYLLLPWQNHDQISGSFD